MTTGLDQSCFRFLDLGQKTAFSSISEVAAVTAGLSVRLRHIPGTHTITVVWGGHGKR